MPLPPPDQPAAGPPASHPSRTILSSPLAAATRAGIYRRRRRERPGERWPRVFAAVGTLLVHLVFLFSFVLGPAYEVKPPRESKEQFLQVRLIEAPEPPPPPLGTPPKELGPRHQGSASRAVSVSRRSTSMQAVVTAQAAVPASASPVVAQTTKSGAPTPRPVASPPPPVSLPRPAPAPSLQPITQAGVPPTVSLPTPVLQPPVPPKFQPEPVRRPQLEGTRPLPPPPSLALPTRAVSAMPPITVSNIALNTTVPKADTPASVTPVRAEVPATPPVPEPQPITLPAQPLPTVNLQPRLSVPAASVPREQPKLQAAKIDVAEPELAVVPPAPVAPAQVQVHAPSVKVESAQKASASIPLSPIERPQISAPPAVTVTTVTPSPATASTPSESPAPTASGQPAATSSPGHTGTERDVSTAPNATPQGSDTAIPGEPNGVAAVPESEGHHAHGPQPTPGQGNASGTGGKESGTGQAGGNQPGAAKGARQGSPNGYVQLKPSGDTQIMGHGTPNIGYQPTRFDADWTPEDESSVDTALRHAVEKTTVAHTFHLPRGIRVECKVVPLLPMALFGCGNPDPPPAPVAAKVYDRLHLAPANPVAAPTPSPATSTVASATPIHLDNSVQCAEARVAGGPPPPGCEGITLPVKLAHPSTSSSTSWVPASDQFH
ncbi:hypothetical protein [Rhodanobacter koreensis]